MTEEYELAAFDRHSLNFDNVALGRLPTSVTTDPSVQPLRELAYLPPGVMDPHDLPPTEKRAGQLPSEILEHMKETVTPLDSSESINTEPQTDKKSG